MSTLRNCPFCNEKVKGEFPSLHEMEDKKWLLSHYCRKKPFPTLTVTIDIYGDTKDEVIDLWNGVYEEPKSESV